MKVIAGMHHIRKHILSVLVRTKWGRFRDMRPKAVDSNLYSYHLKQLIKEDFIEHTAEKGYRLTPKGLRYVDHVSLESFEPRWQPKVLTKLFVTDSDGRLLMWKKYRQPFIGSWSLPSGKIHYEDPSVELAARRELSYITDETEIELMPCGVSEILVSIGDEIVTHTIEYLFRVTLEPSMITHKKSHWLSSKDMESELCSPGTTEILKDIASHTDYFHTYHRVRW